MKPKLKWKDATSYSRSEPRVPQTYEAMCGLVRAVVTRHIHHRPEEWLFCFGQCDRVLMGNISAEEAMVEAEKQLETYAKQLLAALEGK